VRGRRFTLSAAEDCHQLTTILCGGAPPPPQEIQRHRVIRPRRDPFRQCLWCCQASLRFVCSASGLVLQAKSTPSDRDSRRVKGQLRPGLLLPSAEFPEIINHTEITFGATRN
jgi:hypothetical protein